MSTKKTITDTGSGKKEAGKSATRPQDDNLVQLVNILNEAKKEKKIRKKNKDNFYNENGILIWYKYLFAHLFDKEK